MSVVGSTVRAGTGSAAKQEAPMTTLAGRPNTALLVIDVQNGVVEGSHNRDDTIANINTLIGKARAEGVPVVWVQHSDEELVPGSEKWAYVPELVRRDSEFLSTSATATRSRTLTSRRCSPSAG
jgi:hypothetical protein